MVALPLPIATLPVSSARVEVAPPLFARVLRLISAEVVVVAQGKAPWDTRLLAAVVGEIRFTVPPAKSPPMVLLAMIVLAMLRVAKLTMPSVLPEIVELVTVRVSPGC